MMHGHMNLKAEDCSCETWFDSREGREIYVLSKASRPAIEFAGHPFSGYQDFVRRGKDGLSPSGEEVKNKWRYTATSQYAFVACIERTFLAIVSSVEGATEHAEEASSLWQRHVPNYSPRVTYTLNTVDSALVPLIHASLAFY
jgi:hypothetical protein